MSDTTTHSLQKQPPRKLAIHMWLALAVLALGLGLMAMKIHADSEPGLIPLLLVVLGIAWTVVTWVRGRRR